MKKALIILSGGLDSTVLLHQLLAENYQVQAISFDYGQKHIRELQCAQFQTKKHNIPHKIIDLSFINQHFQSDLLQSGGKIPEGHYEAENMKATVVPNRNMIMLSIAAGVAISEKIPQLFYGAHAGDHAIYPDCRTEFIEKLKDTLAICDWEPINLQAPFQNLDKTQIVKKGLQLKVDFTQTQTCYNGQEKACGKCGSCTERLEAFANNNTPDPIKYI